MNIQGEKIRVLIKIYGLSKCYPEKSYLANFCRDFNLNYSQWNAHIGDRQSAGGKVLDILMQAFPDLNLNWLLKEEKNVFVEKIKEE